MCARERACVALCAAVHVLVLSAGWDSVLMMKDSSAVEEMRRLLCMRKANILE